MSLLDGVEFAVIAQRIRPAYFEGFRSEPGSDGSILKIDRSAPPPGFQRLRPVLDLEKPRIDPLVEVLLTMTLPAPPPAPALSVSEVGAPKVLEIGALTVMSPACVPGEVRFAVVTVTAVPAFSTALMSVLRILELSAVGVKRPTTDPVLPAVALAVISTFESGSNSQRPALPLGALAPPRTPVASRM